MSCKYTAYMILYNYTDICSLPVTTRKAAKEEVQTEVSQSMGKNPLFKGWLEPVSKKPDKAYRKVCKRELAAVVTALRKHKAATYYKEKVSSLVYPTLCRC